MDSKLQEPADWDQTDPEKTIIRLPQNDRRLRDDQRISGGLVLRPGTNSGKFGAELPDVDLRNPLLSAAHTIFTLLPRLRHTSGHSDPGQLRKQFVKQVREFELHARRRGVSRETTVAARYALCSLVDETVLSRSWAHSSLWATQGMLVSFHREVFGGEKFFQLLHKLLPDPGGNRDLLEFMYVCLVMGFQGRYRLLANGREQLDDLRLRVGQAINRLQGEVERELSPTWRGENKPQTPLRGNIALSLTLCGMTVALLVGFLSLNASLGRRADQPLRALRALSSEDLLPQPAMAKLPPSALEHVRPKPKILSNFLAAEISARLLTLEDLADRSVVRISGDNLFASGSAVLNAAYRPVLRRIADAMNGVDGAITITGHTDDRPMHGKRFSSNWDLSEARARAVTDILSLYLHATERLQYEGRGDTEPVAPNDIPANRARNRRVDITLRVPEQPR